MLLGLQPAIDWHHRRPGALLQPTTMSQGLQPCRASSVDPTLQSNRGTTAAIQSGVDPSPQFLDTIQLCDWNCRLRRLIGRRARRGGWRRMCQERYDHGDSSTSTSTSTMVREGPAPNSIESVGHRPCDAMVCERARALRASRHSPFPVPHSRLTSSRDSHSIVYTPPPRLGAGGRRAMRNVLSSAASCEPR